MHVLKSIELNHMKSKAECMQIKSTRSLEIQNWQRATVLQMFGVSTLKRVWKMVLTLITLVDSILTGNCSRKKRTVYEHCVLVGKVIPYKATD